MKKLLFATLAFAGSVVVASAQEATQDSTSVTTSTTVTTSTSVDQEGYVAITAEELPAEVKKALENQDFKGWIINAASHDKKEDKFLVELKNGADTRKVKFSKDGEELKD